MTVCDGRSSGNSWHPEIVHKNEDASCPLCHEMRLSDCLRKKLALVDPEL